MTGRSRTALWIGGGCALAYLAVMVANGSMPVQRQLVRSEAKGVLAEAPETIGRVELKRDGQHAIFLRAGEGGWKRPQGTPLDPVAARHLDTALRMTHRSAPVREIPSAELAGIDRTPFELERPRIAVSLYRDDGEALLSARFGGRNPDDFLQYVQIEGDPRLLLMSRFIGEEWRQALETGASQ